MIKLIKANPGKFTIVSSTAYVITLIIVVFPMKAYAYLDPGSGSYIIQVMLGALLGASYLIKVYWEKIKSFFSGKSSNNSPEPGDEEN